MLAVLVMRMHVCEGRRYVDGVYFSIHELVFGSSSLESLLRQQHRIA